jgi:hypothetical protein
LHASFSPESQWLERCGLFCVRKASNFSPISIQFLRAES